MNTYTTRPNKNGQYIDIVHVNAGPGSGAVVRVPVRSGMEHMAKETAERLLNYMNEREHCLGLLRGTIDN